MSQSIGMVSLGCAKNQVDAEQMLFLLQQAGYNILPEPAGADVVIVNTCGFIESAKTEAIDNILAMAQLKAEGSVGKILVTGCLAQRYQEEILKELPEVEVDHTPVAAEAPRLVVTPLRGDVLTAFSMEELVYSPTLGDWRTHNGVDIAAQQGTTVLAASAGAVLSVTDDPLMGTTVVLEHDNGYQTTYANLQAKPNVEAGDPVSAGQIIGAVGTTAAAESGQPHLHFAVTKDGKAVDPNEYLSG